MGYCCAGCEIAHPGTTRVLCVVAILCHVVFSDPEGPYLRIQRQVESDVAARSPFLTRLNYGLAVVKLRQVCVVDGYWSHTFHIELPYAQDVEEPITTVSAPISEPPANESTYRLICAGQ